MVGPAVNYLALAGAAVASMVIGFLWYGPLFGKQWMKLKGFTDKDKKKAKEQGMGKAYVWAILNSLVMAYVLARFIKLLGASDMAGAVGIAFWAWLGFIATVEFASVIWEKESWSLFILNAAYYLVSLAVMASVLVKWP